MVTNVLGLSCLTLPEKSGTYPVVEMEFHPEANQVEYVICSGLMIKVMTGQEQPFTLGVSEGFNRRDYWSIFQN
jgi:hypothetical protein